MALFGRDYDRQFGSRGGMWGGGLSDRGYDRGYFGNDRGAGYGREDSYHRMRRYEPEMGAERGMGMDRGMSMDRGRYGYDREYGAAGYDRGYKSRWQTDFGDPFGDRAAGTPMRVIRGGYRGGYDRGMFGNDRMDENDRGYFGNDRGAGYGRDYRSNAMGYDPYTGRDGTWRHGMERDRGAYGRDYEGGWFY